MQRTSLVNLNVFSLVLSLFGLVSAASAPLQKVTFVFSGFHERTSFVFVAKGMRFFEEQGIEAQIVHGSKSARRYLRNGGKRRAVLHDVRHRFGAWVHSRGGGGAPSPSSMTRRDSGH